MIHNVPECNDNVIRTEVYRALTKGGYEMSEIEFDRMHRVGEPRNDGKPRVIAAKPTYYNHREKLLSKHIPYNQKQKQAWVSPQYTEKIRETRRQLNEIANARIAKQPSAKIKMRFTTLTINGQRVRPNLFTPTVLDILTVDKNEKADLEALKFQSSEQISESKSNFIARSIPIKNMQDVRKAYKSILLDPDNLSATHNIAGYVLSNGESGYCDDGDYGMGRTLIAAMKKANIKGLAIFLTREYGGIKLGFKRFGIVFKLANQVIPNTPSSIDTAAASTPTPKDGSNSINDTSQNGLTAGHQDSVMDITEKKMPGQPSKLQQVAEDKLNELDISRNVTLGPTISTYSRFEI